MGKQRIGRKGGENCDERRHRVHATTNVSTSVRYAMYTSIQQSWMSQVALAVGADIRWGQ